jgi:hypothetical protein
MRPDQTYRLLDIIWQVANNSEEEVDNRIELIVALLTPFADQFTVVE